MTETRFNALIPDEEAAINYFFNIRYPDGLVCPHCGAKSRVYRCQNRPKICRCKNCDNTFSIFKDTIFEKSKSPIREWLKAMREFLNALYGFTSMHLWRDKGMTKKAAWRRLMQFRIAMTNEDEPEVYSGIVEADETFFGEKEQEYPKSRSTGLYLPKGKPKKGRAADTAVFGIKERNTKHVHAKIMLSDKEGERLSGEQLLREFEIKCESGSIIITDKYSGYKILDKPAKVDLSLLDDSCTPPPVYEHHVISHRDKKFTSGAGIHTNGIEGFWSLLKGTFATYRKRTDKYMQRYIDEVCFRQNTLTIRGTQEEFDLLLKRCVLK